MSESVYRSNKIRGSSDGHDRDGSPPPSKRTKRGKYTSKACGQCQTRKIKCDGNSPCTQCTDKGRECHRQGTDMRGRWRESKKTPETPRDLASRLVRIEQQLGFNTAINSPESSVLRGAEQDRESGPSVRGRCPPTGDSTTQVPAFSGETSITHNMTVVENRLEQMGVQYARIRSPSPRHRLSSRLTPSPESSTNHTSLVAQTNQLRRVLDAHRIVPDREQWEGLLRTFCDEVHILVPFLHLPTLWGLYHKTWGRLLDRQFDMSEQQGVCRVQTVQVLLCLANGRCVESSQFEEDNGPYSAGNSLYSAARDLFGDLLEGFNHCADQLLVLQTVVLMVVYLFRLDAHGSAEKVLALAISHAHHLGLHRNRVVEKMSAFESELSRRLWWCIYLLDRRLAIETGRPFLIQDVNVDVGLPRNVSDAWLTRSRDASGGPDIAETAPENGPTTVPYLIAMTSYSRVIGKVWEALYGAATSESIPSPLLSEYLEHLINQAQRGIHQEFTYDPHCPTSDEAGGRAWWKVKQQFMMRIRWTSLYLLIRKPMLQRVWTPDQPMPEAIENEVICMRLTQRILDDFSRVPEEHPKYTFPFLHYLTGATIIALGLIIKQHSFKRTYGALTLEAARSLKEHCRKTWVSKRMIQTVWKLNQMADATLGPETRSSGVFNRSTGDISTTAPREHNGLGANNVGQMNATDHRRGQHENGSENNTQMPSIRQNMSSDIDQGGSLPEEMVDGGIEWLQSLFTNGLDTHLPPVWD